MSARVVKGLSVKEIKALDPSELIERMTPMIESTLRKTFIPGIESDDIRQELHLVLWRCQRNFNPDDNSGHQDRPSSFFNYVSNAFSNKLGHLDFSGKRQSRAAFEMECKQCGNHVIAKSREVCKCGGTNWALVQTSSVASVEGLMDLDVPIESGDVDVYDFEGDDVINQLLNSVPNNLKTIVKKAATRGKLNKYERERLTLWLSKNPEILSYL